MNQGELIQPCHVRLLHAASDLNPFAQLHSLVLLAAQDLCSLHVLLAFLALCFLLHRADEEPARAPIRPVLNTIKVGATRIINRDPAFVQITLGPAAL